MAFLDENQMQTDVAALPVAADVVSVDKRIELNFKSLPATRVKEIAAATCGVEIVSGATVKLTPEQIMMRQIQQLENGQMHMASLTQAGVAYLNQIHGTMSDLDREILKLEQVGKPSIFTRILGKGVATQGTLDALEKIVDVCGEAIHHLQDHAQNMRKEMDNQMVLCERAAGNVDEITTPEGFKLRDHVYKLRDQFRERSHGAKDLLKAAQGLTNEGLAMRQRADDLIAKHKAYLAGRAAP